MKLHNLKITSTSMVNKEGLQRIKIVCETSGASHVFLNAFCGKKKVVENYLLALGGGKTTVTAMLPYAHEDKEVLWQITNREGTILGETSAVWKKPRELTLYAMTSSHTDIGLHNSQYIQRFNSSRFVDEAKKLCDETENRNEWNRYHYIIEGTWFFNNYIEDRTTEEVRELIEDYIKTGKIGICCCVAGNHTQMYGLEELCMSTYERSRLKDEYGIISKTMSMIDNNGISMSIIAPYVEAGIENIIFAPNQWNPLPSTIWKMDRSVEGYTWNPEAQGGGSRIDVRYDSDIPMLFYWKDVCSEKKILVWCSTQYGFGGNFWGVSQRNKPHKYTVEEIEDILEKNLSNFEEKYPYDTWLFAAYDDDMEPNLFLADTFEMWNEKWAWPRFSLCGNLDRVFDAVKEKYGDLIPTLEGDITGGWYQQPVTTPELIAKKFEIDRKLPVAEKLSVLAGLLDDEYRYPAVDFKRAWEYLLWYDEHSYGTSGYQGKRVYETWIQRNDWLNRAKETAENECCKALNTIASYICSDEESVVIFNPASEGRQELVLDKEGRYVIADIPKMGYTAIAKKEFCVLNDIYEKTDCPPKVENEYYKVVFDVSGGIRSIFDKQLRRELVDEENVYAVNQIVYTRDNHATFMVPEQAEFEVKRSPNQIVVTVINKNSVAGADVVRTVTLNGFEKRIEIENRLEHVYEFYNKCRYDRYLYFTFPFAVPEAKRYVHLNGSVAEYGKTVTGHGTDVYMGANEWCCSENGDMGVALIMPDTTLVEFDHIHPDKTDYGCPGEKSGIYSYVANDWLQMHAWGSDYFNFTFRYSIISYQGTYQEAGISKIAERICTPVVVTEIGKQEGILPKKSASLFDTGNDMRLISLKRAKDGDGIIARLYGTLQDIRFSSVLTDDLDSVRVMTDESERNDAKDQVYGFYTYVIGKNRIRLKTREAEVKDINEVGSVYTGLLTTPKAARGEDSGHLYLLWGQSKMEGLSYYRLYRSEEAQFVCDEKSFIADVLPGKYRVVSYEDHGLKEYSMYYYRVCAVNYAGECGPLSPVFCARTKETL